MLLQCAVLEQGSNYGVGLVESWSRERATYSEYFYFLHSYGYDYSIMTNSREAAPETAFHSKVVVSVLNQATGETNIVQRVANGQGLKRVGLSAGGQAISSFFFFYFYFTICLCSLRQHQLGLSIRGYCLFPVRNVTSQVAGRA
jgi:hypothetical protein